MGRISKLVNVDIMGVVIWLAQREARQTRALREAVEMPLEEEVVRAAQDAGHEEMRHELVLSTLPRGGGATGRDARSWRRGRGASACVPATPPAGGGARKKT